MCPASSFLCFTQNDVSGSRLPLKRCIQLPASCFAQNTTRRDRVGVRGRGGSRQDDSEGVAKGGGRVAPSKPRAETPPSPSPSPSPTFHKARRGAARKTCKGVGRNDSMEGGRTAKDRPPEARREVQGQHATAWKPVPTSPPPRIFVRRCGGGAGRA